MTNRDFLKELVAQSEQTYGPNAPVTLHLKAQLAQSEELSSQPKPRRFLVGVRSKRPE